MSWGLLSFVLSGVGMIFQSIAAQQAAAARQAQARYQAAVARNNAIIAEQNAEKVEDIGLQQEEEHRERIRQTKGAAKTQMASLGFLVDTEDETNALLLADLAEAGEYDLMKIRERTWQNARAARLEGYTQTAQAGLLDAKASSISPGMEAFGTFLQGASQTAYIGKKFDIGVKTG